MSEESKFLLARTFYWVAGAGAAITAGLAVSVLAMAETQGKHSSNIQSLQQMEHPVARKEHQVDHDMLILLSKDVNYIKLAIDEIKQGLRDGN